MNVEKFIIYTDGGCSKNNSKNCLGAYAYLIISGNNVIDRECCKVTDTTNNRMELMGAISGMNRLKLKYYLAWKNLKSVECKIITDSQYLSNGYNNYLQSWTKNNWIKSNGQKVLNIDLWKQIAELSPEFLRLEFLWIRGHAYDLYNNEVDAMINKVLYGKKKKVVEKFVSQDIGVDDLVIQDVNAI